MKNYLHSNKDLSILRFKLFYRILFLFFTISFYEIGYSQSKEYSRPEITILISNPYDLGEIPSEIVKYFSKPEFISVSYIDVIGSGNLSPLQKIPKDWYIPRDLLRSKDNYDFSNKNAIPYFPNVDYNIVSNSAVNFSFENAISDPKKYLLSYSKEILRYIFNSEYSSKNFKLDRIVNRTMINAKDNIVNLSNAVVRGENIIKDDLKTVFDNIYLIGIDLDSYKMDMSGFETVKANIYLFKISYDNLLKNQQFWSECFSQGNGNCDIDKFDNDIRISLLKKDKISAVTNRSKGSSIFSFHYQFLEEIFKKFN